MFRECLALRVKQGKMVGEMVGDGQCFLMPYPSTLRAGKILVVVNTNSS
jgi:hypothetical protein